MKETAFRAALRAVLVSALSLACALTLAAQEPKTGADASAGAASTAKPTQAGEDASRPAARGDQYRIGMRDVLSIRVTAPEVVQQFSSDALEVNECGMIPLLSIQSEEQNKLRAAGLTTNELQEQLRKFYTKYKLNPQVVVRVKEHNSQPVAVNGAVVRAGQFQMRRPVRLLELVQFYAGGPTERSGGQIQLARMPALGMCDAGPAADESALNPSFLLFNLKDTLEGDEKSNPYLQPGDVVTLTEAKEAYVVGNVLRPGPVLLKDDQLTVSRAIAMVGGTMPDTKKEKVRIIRQEPRGGARREIFVDLRAIDRRQAEDVALLPNDIIDVPTSGGKRMLRSLIGTVVPSVGQLPVQIIR